MGYLNINAIAEAEIVDEATYKKYDLSEAGKLTALLLRVEDIVSTAHIHTELGLPAHITKLEVMGKKDKSIKSLRGLDQCALHAHSFGRMPPYTHRMHTGELNSIEFLLKFGLYIGDPNHYLDLSKDSDVDFKITNDIAVATYWTDTKLKYTLHEIFLPDDTPPERGYVRSYEHSYWPAVSGGTVSKKLEVGNKVFRVQLRAAPDVNTDSGYNEGQVYTLINKVSVDFRNKKEIMWDDLLCADIKYFMSMLYGGMWHVSGEGALTHSGHSIETQLGHAIGTQITGDENIDATHYFGIYTDQRSSRKQVFALEADRFNYQLMGILPYNAIQIPFDLGYPEVPLLDTAAKAPVYIRVYSSSSSGDVYMVVEELGTL